ncbi:MAG: hypothetical protein IKI38_02680 [Mogibacterium sp.]|nr:hypothetical protein [Mogibacterium sp.]
MFSEYFLRGPQYWILPWLAHSIAYFFVLKKAGLRTWKAAVPFVAEHELSTVLFRKTRTFWRPFIIAAVFTAGAYYLGPSEGVGYVYMAVAQFVYEIFQIKLYVRLGRSFGKKAPFIIFMILIPTVALLILGLGKSEYRQLEFRPQKKFGAFYTGLRKVTVALFSLAEIIVLVVGVGFFTVKTYPPRVLVNTLLNDTYANTSSIESDGKALTREDTMGEAAATAADMPVSRPKFFPDHSNDKNVVVMEYIIGSNLEDRLGMASANIRMMQDATQKGEALTFVLEAGGSKRWFTSGITEGGYGRYTVKGGNVEKVTDIETDSMENPSELTDFIKWTAENYPADRYMLVLWDHGGGVAFGYGEDQLNHRTDTENEGIHSSEIASAIAEANVKFDVIGFDACLMQDIEIAKSLEPYADYYLASEEVEGGYGWYYTSAFGKLAENPGMSSEEFGKDIISSYDQFNTILNDGNPDSAATLSFVDLTLVGQAYDKVESLFSKADKAIKDDQKDFAELGLAAMNAYTFNQKLQLDLVDFISKLNDTDVNNSICSEKEGTEAVNAVKACVVYRNRDSADGVNGMAVAFPYQEINFYSDTADQLDKLDAGTQRSLFNDVFSIIAVQKKAEHEAKLANQKSRFGTFIENLRYVDNTNEEWYVKGFEDYEPTTTLLDIPLLDTGNGWLPQIPQKTWNIIADCRTAVYQKAEDGTLRYLGSQHIGDSDEDGHPLVDMDDTWVHINGHLVCYESEPVRETDEGTVFSGDTMARLNGKDDIIIHIEWGPVADDEDALTGRILGYDFADDDSAFMQKGMEQFKTGDSIEFLFDYYDEEGSLIKTEPFGGSLIVSKKESLKAEDQLLPEGDIQFHGILTDVYQRELITEVLEGHIGE